MLVPEAGALVLFILEADSTALAPDLGEDSCRGIRCGDGKLHMVEALDISIEKPVHRVYYVDNQSLAVPVHEVALESDFLPDRLAFPPGFDRPVVLATHKAIELAPMLAKQSTQTLLVQAFEIGPVLYPQLSELGGSDLAHTKEFLDRQH